jgi:hypothetical protein
MRGHVADEPPTAYPSLKSSGSSVLLIAVAAAVALWVALETYTRSETAKGLLVTASPATKGHLYLEGAHPFTK